MKFLLIITTIYIFSSMSQVLSESKEEPIGGMYFSYYSDNDEIAKLEFNIAEKNITNIKLYIKYYNRGSKEVNINCKSTDLSTRKDYHQINITCNKLELRQYLVGNIKLLKLKKRSENGVMGNLNILRIAHKDSFYEQLKKNPSHTIVDHEEFIIKAEKEKKERERLAKEKAIEEEKMAKERLLQIEKELKRQEKLAIEEEERKKKAAEKKAKKEELALLAAEKERERKEKLAREKKEEKERIAREKEEKKRKQEEKLAREKEEKEERIARERAEKVELALLEREKERIRQKKLIEEKATEEKKLAKEIEEERAKKEELALLAAEQELKRQENIAREVEKKAEERNIAKEREQLEELITEKKELEKERARQKTLEREKLVAEEIEDDKKRKAIAKIAEEEKIALERIQLEKLIKEKEEKEKELKQKEDLARKKVKNEKIANNAVKKELAILDLEYLEILWLDVKDFVSKNKDAFPPLILVKLSAPIKSIINQRSISTSNDIDDIHTFSNFIMKNSDFITFRNKKELEREKENVQITITLKKKLQLVLDICLTYIENNPMADEAHEVAFLYNLHKDNLNNKDKNILKNSITEINNKLSSLGLK